MGNKLNAFLHLTILVFYICRPVVPYIEYALFKNYIAQNLCVNKDEPESCCQGKCHLEKELKKNSETTDTDSKQSSKKITSKQLSEFILATIVVPKATNIALPPSTNTLTLIGHQIQTAIFVPPKA